MANQIFLFLVGFYLLINPSLLKNIYNGTEVFLTIQVTQTQGFARVLNHHCGQIPHSQREAPYHCSPQ